MMSVLAGRSSARQLSVAAVCAAALIAVFAGSARAAAPVGEVYVPDTLNGEVSQFGANTAGILSALAYPTVPAGNYPAFDAVTPNGKYVYVTNENDNTVSEYAVDPSGLLEGALVPIGTAGTAGCPHGIALNHAGTYAYVANWCSNSVGEYKVESDGALLAIGTVATGSLPYGVAVAPNDKSVYDGDGSGIGQFAAATNGTLTPDNPSHVSLAGGECAQQLAVSPNSKSVYAADPCDGYVYHLVAASNGTLTLSDLKGGLPLQPYDVALSPNGKYVYATNSVSSGQDILEYTASTTGVLTFVGTAPTGNTPTGIAVTSSGKFAYATNRFDDTVWQYAVGKTGLLSELAVVGLPAGSDAYGIAVRK